MIIKIPYKKLNADTISPMLVTIRIGVIEKPKKTSMKAENFFAKVQLDFP